MAMGPGCYAPQTPDESPGNATFPAGLAVFEWTLSPLQDPSGTSPDASYTPPFCSLLCLLTNFPARGVTGITAVLLTSPSDA